VTSNIKVEESLRTAMVDLIQGHHPRDSALEKTLLSITSGAVELIEGVDFADMLIVHEGESRSVAPTFPLAAELDAVQLQHQQGPCLDAAVSETVVITTDMREEQRWPAFASAAVAAGVHGILSYRLIPQHKATGALSLFSRKPHSFDADGKTMGALLATMATVAMMTSFKQEQFETALASRDLISQAKGILMNHYKVDADRAFEMLKHLSQHDNIPLRTIAQRIIEAF
jgi:hypothetical protein